MSALSPPPGYAIGLWTVAHQEEGRAVTSNVLMTTASTAVLLTPDQAENAGQMLKDFAAKARAEALAFAEQPEAEALALMSPEGQA